MKKSSRVSFFQSMKGKIFLLFMALSLIPMAITGIIIIIQIQQSIKSNIETQYNTITDLQVKEIKNWINERKSDVVTLSGIARIQSLDATKACPAVKQYFDQWSIYQDIFVALPDGSRLCDAIDDKTNVGDSIYFQESVNGKTVISDPLLSNVNDTPIIIFSTPLIVDKKIIGVVATSMSTAYFTDLLKATQNGQSREAYLVTKNGIFITASRFSDDLIKAGLIKDKVELALKIDTPGFRKAQAGESGIDEYQSYHNTMVLGAYRPIPELGNGAVLLVEQEIWEVMSVANRLRDIIVIIGIICALIVTIPAQVFGRSLIHPLEVMSDTLDSLAHGNLDQELLDKAKQEYIQRKDEYGIIGRSLENVAEYFKTISTTARQIAEGNLTVEIQVRSEKDEIGKSFSEMILGLRKLTGGIKDNAIHLEHAAYQLVEAFKQIETAISQISITTQQVAKGTTEQTNAITNTATALDEVVNAIDKVSQGTHEQAKAVNQVSTIMSQFNTVIQQVAGNIHAVSQNSNTATQATHSGTEAVDKTVIGMNNIKQKVGISTQKIHEMGKHSDEIGIILITIEDIASQTNLLALNAAIEAARAGEQGKGFAVVADEVRKLAEQAAKSTKEIGGLIKGIQKTVTEAINAMEEGNQEVEHGVERTQQAGKVLEEILVAIKAVDQQAQQSTKATHEMNISADHLLNAIDTISSVIEENTTATDKIFTSSNEVSQAIESIASVSEENSAATEEVAASIEEVSAQIEEVNGSAAILLDMAHKLRNLIAQFSLEAYG